MLKYLYLQKHNSIRYFLFHILSIIFLSGFPLYGQQSDPDSLLRQLEIQKTDTGKVAVLLKISKHYQSVNAGKKSLEYFEKALQLSQKVAYLKGEISSANSIGIYYYKKSDYKNATKYYLIALKALEKKGDKKNSAVLYTNIGLIYLDEGFYNQAFDFLEKSLKIRLEVSDSAGFPGAYNNLGLLEYQRGYSGGDNQQKKQLYEAAERYHHEAMKWSRIIEDSTGLAYALANLSNVYRELGNLGKAVQYCLQAIEIEKILGDLNAESSSYIDLGLAYLANKEYNKAEEAFLKALRTGEELSDMEVIKYSCQNLEAVYEEKGDYRKAILYFKRYNALKDSLLNSENTRQINEMQAIYETDKKDQENKLLAAENSLKNEEIAEQKRTRNYLVGILVFSALVIAGAVLAYRKIRSSNKLLSIQKHSIEQKNTQLERQKEEIEKQKELVEDHQKEIIDSINYAQKIQSAILPSLNDFRDTVKNGFVLFKPKDIVSGDFYWLSEKENYIFYAAADCTGHGVPGGFMSMLGTSLLNEVVNEKKIYEPADVLDMLRVKIILALKQKGESGENKDGMDMVFCRLDKNKKQLVYAAANNPLWLVRNGQCIEYRADKQPVGISGGKSEQFTQHTIDLQAGDCIYIFTDGFADQFGGPKGKKFKYKQFQELLVENASKPVAEQHNILEKSIDSWRGTLEQVDDVLVIGVRV